MQEVTIAVASDLHCAPGSAVGRSFLTVGMPLEPITSHPIQSLLGLIDDQKLTADVLAIPGDFTWAADISGLKAGWHHTNEVREALGAPYIVGTLGNHDVYREDGSDRDPLDLPQQVGGDFPIAGRQAQNGYWADCFCTEIVGDCAFLVLNTVPLRDAELAKTRGAVDETCLSRLSKQLGKLKKTAFRVAICHHHPLPQEDPGHNSQDIMENAGKLLDLLAEYGFDLVVHGHKHFPRLRRAHTDARFPVFVLAAGTLSAVLEEGLATCTRNTFHMVRLWRESEDGSCRGHVTTWQWNLDRGWKPASEDSVRLPHETGFGSERSPQQLAAESTS